MSYKCEKCGKGAAHGHAVSHAKNRTHRLFKPNLQKLKVVKNNLIVRVKFCTSCIKRLKRDGRFGVYSLLSTKVRQEKTKIPQILSVEKKEQKVEAKKETKEVVEKEKMSIEDIVGLPAGEAGKKG